MHLVEFVDMAHLEDIRTAWWLYWFYQYIFRY